MRELLKNLFILPALFVCGSMMAQAPTYDEMSIESDSTGSAYKPSGKNHVLVRSKRGNSGLNKTPNADAITSAEVTEIVLVYTETDASAINEREEANRERWENLLMTYPEFFQYSTTFKNVCQCAMGGDAEALKKGQGFYVYVNGEVPKMEEPKAPEAPPAPKPAKTEEPPAPAKTAKTEDSKPAAPPKTEPVSQAPKQAEPSTNTVQEEAPAVAETEAPKAAPKKKAPPATTKGRKAKNPKACRTACYEGGDEDLYAFFKNNIKLSKKQKRKAKSVTIMVKLQLDAEGSIKKTMVTGENSTFNKMAEDAIKSMNSWNAAVKGGMAVKSEVKFMLKFDKENKCLKPFDIMVSPKLGPKCKCASDSEIFGSD